MKPKQSKHFGGVPARSRVRRQAKAGRSLNRPTVRPAGGGALSFPINRLPLDSIRTDGGTQARAEMKPGVAAEYAEAIAAGAKLPPIVVFHDGADNWPGDGFHRLEGHRLAGRKVIAAEVRPGTKRDAILFALGANDTHGLRRTNADKQKAITTALLDPEWSQWTDREIARRCAVDHKSVGNLRRRLAAAAGSNGEVPQPRASSTTALAAPTPVVAPAPDGPAPRLSPHILRESINAKARAEAACYAALKLPECHGCGGTKTRQEGAYYYPKLCELCMHALPKPLVKALGVKAGDQYFAALAEALEFLEAKQLTGAA